MKQDFPLPIESCSTGWDPQDDGFVDESGLDVFAFFSCLSIPTGGCCATIIMMVYLPVIRHSCRRRFFTFYPSKFMCLILAWISNQMTTAFALRPLSMSVDIRFLSMLGIQWIGFGLCLIASFIYGVKHAFQVRSVNRTIPNDYVWIDHS